MKEDRIQIEQSSTSNCGVCVVFRDANNKKMKSMGKWK
jgi:hypothetical protein